jgi:hypothetical protein
LLGFVAIAGVFERIDNASGSRIEILAIQFQRDRQSIFDFENRTKTRARSSARDDRKNMGSAMTQYSLIQNSHPLHTALLGGAVVAMLATAGCGSSAPSASDGPGLNLVEMAAARGDPFAMRGLTPVQQRRVSTYQASHPDVTPTWGPDTTNMLMAGGAGYVAGSTLSATRTGAALTTAEAVAPEIVAPAAERTAARLAIGGATAGAVERVGIGEVAAGTVERIGIGEVAAGAVERAGIVELLELLLFF